MRIALALLFTASAAALSVHAEGIPVQITYVEKSDVSGRLLSVLEDQSVRFQPEGGDVGELAVADLVQISFDGADEVAKSDVVVVLRGGDRLQGRVTGGSAENVRIACRSLGTFKVPLEQVRGMVFPSAPASLRDRLLSSLESGRGGNDDRVVLPNGDVMKGIIQTVSDKGITLSNAGGERTIQADQLAAFAMAQTAAPDAASAGAKLVAADGSVLSGRLSRVGDGVLEFTTAIGRTVRVSPRALKAIRFQGGRLTYVSDLKPRNVTQTALIEGEPSPWRMRVDTNVLGTPLRLGKRTYRKGLGMHTQCVAQFGLGGKYARLLGVVGIDSGTFAGESQAGGAVFRVRLDGKTIFDSGPLRRGDDPKPLDLVVTQGQELILEVSFVNELDDHGSRSWSIT